MTNNEFVNTFLVSLKCFCKKNEGKYDTLLKKLSGKIYTANQSCDNRYQLALSLINAFTLTGIPAISNCFFRQIKLFVRYVFLSSINIFLIFIVQKNAIFFPKNYFLLGIFSSNKPLHRTKIWATFSSLISKVLLYNNVRFLNKTKNKKKKQKTKIKQR